MLFNSYEFLCFFPIVWALYWSVGRRLRVQNVLILVASYVFYAWWSTKFLWLIVFVTLMGYGAGLAMERFSTSSRLRRAACGVCIAVCLGVLGAFKYYDFFVGEFNAAMHGLGLGVCMPLWRVALPVGISFYTFQVLGYAIDVCRRRVPVCHDVASFAAFVGFFPQLVAGPIERAGDLLPQMQRPRRLTETDIVEGLRLMLWGFVKKMLLADRCAPFVAAAYANPSADAMDLWVAAVLFAFQIYGDFSGYSDIAVGAARLFGIRLTRNFRLPYFACNVPDFWRRWHITLMTWFKDYVYIPLGGSRAGRWRHVRNLSVVFLVSGLWHGANWTFVAWGAFQLLGFAPQLIRKYVLGSAPRATTESHRLLPTWHEVWSIPLTFVFACTGWVFFRSETIGAALDRLALMYGSFSLHKPWCGWGVFLPVIFVVGAEWLTRSKNCPLDFSGRGVFRFRAVRWVTYYALVLAVLYWGGAQAEFIYFQF